jgi:type I restriction enzyme R subunit
VRRDRPTPPPADSDDERERERVLQVEGFDVRVTDAGRLVLAQVDGRVVPVTVEEYRERLAERLVAEAPTLDEFRARWIVPQVRQALLDTLPDGGRSALLVRTLAQLDDCDLYDVLADLAYGQAPLTRDERAAAFGYKHTTWLESLPAATAATIRALAEQFARAGTEGLENPAVFHVPGVRRAGGLAALRALGKPVDVLRETKERMFAA